MTSFIDDDGQELEYNGADFAVTKQLLSFRDFRLKGNFSTNIKLANTAKNRAILEYFGDSEINPTTRKKFSIYRDGNKVDAGYLIISGFKKDLIEAFFVSGNSNLFEAINFKCNEIVTTRYDTRDIAFNIVASWTKTEGIIYPIIDFLYKGEKYGNNFKSGDIQTGYEDDVDTLHELIPCCYIHTILREVLRKADVAFTGDLFNDPFFRTLIITPNSVDDVRTGPPGNLYPSGKLETNIIKPEYIAPNIKVVDFLKWIAISFGCLIEYDTESNSVSFNLLDKKDKNEAQDWSTYYLESEIEVDKYYDRNYIRYQQQKGEVYVERYNQTRDVLYGDMLIDSGKGDESTKEIYTAPFQSSYDVVGSSKLKFATPVCEMYRLINDVGYTFSSVSNSGTPVTSGDASGGSARFNGTFPFVGSGSFIFRVESGTYAGYHIGSNANTTRIDSDMPFIGNASGTLYTQKHERISGQKILSVITGISPFKFMQYQTVQVDGNGAYTSVATAYFSKLTGRYGDSLNSAGAYSQGLNYDTIDEPNRNDKSLKDMYLKTTSTILMNPPYKAKFLLPQNVFYSYTSQIVYIKAMDLNGYFLVDKIENYVDSKTPVTCYLSKI